MSDAPYECIYSNTEVPVAFGSQYSVLVASNPNTWLEFDSMRLEMPREKVIYDGLRDLLLFEEKHMPAAIVYVEFEVVNVQFITSRCEVLIVI